MPHHRINPIDGDDVADLILRQLKMPIPGDRELPVGGPSILTFRFAASPLRPRRYRREAFTPTASLGRDPELDDLCRHP
jgi:uncharacterized protein YbjT (DUF2867 family)